ncbi:MAG TPA: SDR family oxidoreductase [Sphingomicrobium sp.]|jgi:NAD(P)-dependent dehydrogenase (short-subunit alcohol dehydrogenase family)|nr:SDR family oxidoreductase [Sphingomicrobium sp.]
MAAEPESTKTETVVITGASAGIGRATAREFARNGANVALLARGRDGLEAAMREVEELGGKALAISVDVADAKAVDEAAERVERELGPIDVWVNNAFAGIFSRFMDITPEEYERVTAVTYLGQVNGTRAALKRMLPRDQGAIVLVGSALAYRGIPLQSAYCGSKHAIQGFIDSVRTELLHDESKVTITMVQMPGVNTPQFDWIRAKLPGQPRPVGKVYQPEVAARAIRFAAHDGRKEMLVGLPTVEAVWGNKVASSLLDDYLAATAFKAQQRPERVSPDRKDNLFEPVAGDHGARGSFSDEAVDSSAELWVSKNKTQLGLAALGAAVVAAGAGFMLAGRNGEKAKAKARA